MTSVFIGYDDTLFSQRNMSPLMAIGTDCDSVGQIVFSRGINRTWDYMVRFNQFLIAQAAVLASVIVAFSNMSAPLTRSIFIEWAIGACKSTTYGINVFNSPFWVVLLSKLGRLFAGAINAELPANTPNSVDIYQVYLRQFRGRLLLIDILPNNFLLKSLSEFPEMVNPVNISLVDGFAVAFMATVFTLSSILAFNLKGLVAERTDKLNRCHKLFSICSYLVYRLTPYKPSYDAGNLR